MTTFSDAPTSAAQHQRLSKPCAQTIPLRRGALRLLWPCGRALLASKLAQQPAIVCRSLSNQGHGFFVVNPAGNFQFNLEFTLRIVLSDDKLNLALVGAGDIASGFGGLGNFDTLLQCHDVLRLVDVSNIGHHARINNTVRRKVSRGTA